MRNEIYDIAKEYLTYDGVNVRWKKKIKKSKYYPGDIAGTVNKDGYIRVALFRKGVAAHRFAWEFENGEIPDGMQVDHINHIRTDNRIENLRLVAHQENSINTKKPKDNKSGCVGVFWYKQKGKFTAYIGGRRTGSKENLGSFDDWFEAVCARKSAESRLGYHENHGKTITIES